MLRLPVLPRLPRLPVATAAVAVAVVAALAVAVCAEYAPVDGRGNNVMEPGRGATLSPFQAGAFHTTYSDGVSALADGPPAREVSNVVFGTKSFQYNRYEVSYMNAVWGQFVAHDMVLTAPNAAAPEEVPIHVPTCDAFMDAECEGNKTFPFVRTQADPSTGTSTSNPRVQLNAQTAYLDASTVYGPDVERLALLRTFYKGTLKADLRDGCPHNHLGHFQAGPTPATAQRLTGDVRGNVNPGLLALHGVWVLEHNRLCGVLSSEHADWTDEELFQEARKRVVGMIQAITVYEYLPRTMGRTLGQYGGYDPSADASVDPLFGIAAYRYGHSGINAMYLRSNSDGSPHPAGPLLLRDSYFQPERYLNQGGIAPILRGLLYQPEADIDTSMVDDVRNFLINLRDDLAAQDIMRGRDFGLPKYGAARRLYGLPVPATWEDMTPDIQVQAALAELYASPEEVDLWVGGLCELPEQAPSMVGPLFAAIIEAQFERARAGDRFWFEGSEYSAELSAELAGTRLADVLARTVGVAVPAGTSAFDLHDPYLSPVPVVAIDNQAPVNDSTTPSDSTSTPSDSGDTASGGGATWTRVEVSSDLTLRYSVGTTYVELEFTLQGQGWIGFGVGDGMMDADVVTMRMVGGTADVEDRTASGYSLPSLDADQSTVELVSAAVEGGVSTVHIRRLITPTDAADKPISTTDVTGCMFAWSTSSNSVAYHGGNRVRASITFTAPSTSTTTTSGTTTTGSDDTGSAAAASSSSDAQASGGAAVSFDLSSDFEYSGTFIYHGLSMLVSWGFVVPIACLVCRYARWTKSWLAFHKWAMILVATLTLPAAGAGLSSYSDSVESRSHVTLGFAICVLLMSQMIMGGVSYAQRSSNNVPKWYYLYVRRCHRLLGWSLAVCGVLNSYRGVMLLWPELEGMIVAVIVLESIGLVGGQIYYTINSRKCTANGLGSDGLGGKLTKHAKRITRQEIADAMCRNRVWMLFGTHVFDCTDYAGNHPGGAYLLRLYAGNDVTAYFAGNALGAGQLSLHSHSTRARDMLHSMFIGVLQDENGTTPLPKQGSRATSTGTVLGTAKTLVRKFTKHILRAGEESPEPAPRTAAPNTAHLAKATDVSPASPSGVAPSRDTPTWSRSMDIAHGASSETVGTHMISEKHLIVGDQDKPHSLWKVFFEPLAEDHAPCPPIARWRLSHIGTHAILRMEGTKVSPTDDSRPYSIVWEPGRRGFWVYIRPARGGRFAQRVVMSAVGRKMCVHGPLGRGLPVSCERGSNLLAIAQGTGAAPFLDLVKVLQFNFLKRQAQRAARVREQDPRSASRMRLPGAMDSDDSGSDSDTDVATVNGGDRPGLVAPVAASAADVSARAGAGAGADLDRPVSAFSNSSMAFTAIDDDFDAPEDAISRVQGKLALVVCSRRVEDLLEGEWLAAMDKALDNFELHVHVSEAPKGPHPFTTLTAGGRLTDASLQAVTPTKNLERVLVCGSLMFQESMKAKLAELGLPRFVVEIVA